MGQLLVPAMIGAGVGALGSAAMGKSPFTGALLGAGIGAGGAGLFGGGAAAGASSTAGAVGTTGEIGGSLLTTAGGLGGGSVALPAASSGALSGQSILAGKGSNLTGAGMLGSVNNAASITPNLLSSVGAGGVMTNGGAIPLTMMDKVGNYISNLPSNAMDYVKNNPLTSAKTALDIATPAPEAPMQDRSTPIRQGNTDMLYAPNFNTNPSATLSNVSPNPLPQKDNQAGLLGMLQTRIPLTEEEKAQLARLGQQY
jgi:hypothetical protein